MASKPLIKRTCLLFTVLGCLIYQVALGQSTWTQVRYSKRSQVMAVNTSMAYDNSGFLWVAGRASPSSWGLEQRPTTVLQIFDGHSFQDVPLPDYAKDVRLIIQIAKDGDGTFYLLCAIKNKYRILGFDPITAKFRPIWFEGFDSKTLRASRIFQYEGHNFIILQNRNEKAVLFELDGERAIKKMAFDYDALSIGEFTRFIPYTEFILLRTLTNGVLLFDWDGNLIKSFDGKAFPSISEELKIKGSVYFLVDRHPILYRFSEKEMKPVKAFDFQELTKNNKFWLWNDKKGNLLLTIKNGDRLNVYKIEESGPVFKGGFLSRNLSHAIFYSNDFSKGFWTANSYYDLTHYYRKTGRVRTFLPNYSIRSLYPVDSNKVIVASETSGWFILDLLTGSLKPYPIWDGKKLLPMNQTRNILPTSDPTVIWTNNWNGLVQINLKTHQATPWEHDTFTCLEWLNDSTLIYGTYHKGIGTFNVRTKEYSDLLKTDSLWIMDIETKENTAYIASDKGLLVYDAENEETDFYKASKFSKDNFFVTIIPDTDGTILLGSWTGKLYRFHPNTGRFELVFTSKKKAPIASLIFYEKKLWLNTYEGYIALNMESKTPKIFGMVDGFSSNEANRYSKLVTDYGLLIGTVNGLNLFGRDSYSGDSLRGHLMALSMTYYQENAKKIVHFRNRSALMEAKEVILPAGHRSLQLDFGMENWNSSVLPEFRYRFDGSPWRDISNGNSLRFESLEPGLHTVELAAFGLGNNQIGSGLSYTLRVKDFFYNSWWFRVANVLLLLGAVWYVFHNRLQKVKLANALRTKIASDLHDELGGLLSGIFLRTDMSWRDEKDEAKMKRMQKAANLSKKAIRAMRDVVWSIDTRQDNWESLIARTREYGKEFFEGSEIAFVFGTTGRLPKKLSQEKKQAIYLICKEALNNCLKYAEASEVRLSFSFSPHRATLEIIDNGVGLRGGEHFSGQGLKNMKMRARQIKADIELVSSEGEGTIILLRIAL